MHLFHTDPGNRNFLEEMRGCHCTGCMFCCCHRLELRIVKGPLIVFGRLPNCIVDKTQLPAIPRWSCVEINPGCRFMISASAAHALGNPCTSSGFTLNLLIRITGPMFFSSICMESVIFSSISTSFAKTWRCKIWLFYIIKLVPDVDWHISVTNLIKSSADLIFNVAS